MGCAASVAIGRKKRKNIPLVSIFVPPMRVPAQSDLQGTLKGLIPKDLADRIGSLRNQIVLVAEDTGLVLQSYNLFNIPFFLLFFFFFFLSF